MKKKLDEKKTLACISLPLCVSVLYAHMIPTLCEQSALFHFGNTICQQGQRKA